VPFYLRKSRIRKDGEQAYIMVLKRENNDKFFNYVGACPSEIKDIYGYKFID
jgi:hypothetical protein